MSIVMRASVHKVVFCGSNIVFKWACRCTVHDLGATGCRHSVSLRLERNFSVGREKEDGHMVDEQCSVEVCCL